MPRGEDGDQEYLRDQALQGGAAALGIAASGSGLRLLPNRWVAEAYAHTAAVLRNKNYACCFECRAKLLHRRHPRVPACLEASYCGLSNLGGAREIR
jgi:hypothetical protein